MSICCFGLIYLLVGVVFCLSWVFCLLYKVGCLDIWCLCIYSFRSLWWIVLFINMSGPVWSDKSVITPACFLIPFAWTVLFCPITFSLCLCWWVSCRQQVGGPCFPTHLNLSLVNWDHLCLGLWLVICSSSCHFAVSPLVVFTEPIHLFLLDWYWGLRCEQCLILS